MILGEIYRWDTDQAIGHVLRRKYHIYLGEAGWRVDGHAFLFISSADYGGDYPLSKVDYPFFTNPLSYVSCNGIVSYSDAELAFADPQLMGSLSPLHLAALRNAVAASETMEGWQINLVCNFLAAAI